MKIVFLDAATMVGSSLEPIAALGELIAYDNSTREEAYERVKDCEVLIINKIKVDEDLFSHAPSLKLVCEAATGVNNIDLDAAERRGIPVRNVAGYSTASVAQMTWMHILSLAGNSRYYDGFVKDGTYSASGYFTDTKVSYPELAGKTIGIVGMGTIGSRVARIAKEFGMNVCYYSTSGTNHCTEYPSLGIDELLAVSDVVSINAPYNERTAGLIGYDNLKKMKKSAIIVNLGRGGIVVEDALARAIDEGLIAGAGLDVFVKEPLPADHPLLHTRHPERLSFTPHVGWSSDEARDRLIEGIAQNIAKGW